MNLRVSALRTSIRWLLKSRRATSIFDRAVSPRPSSGRPPATLEDAIGDEPNCWTQEAQARIRARLRLAAEGEWAGAALAAFDRGPDAFLLHHFQSSLEHAQTAIALYRAVEEVCNRTCTESLDDALTRLGLSEADWLRQSGLALFDRDDGLPTKKEQTQ